MKVIMLDREVEAYPNHWPVGGAFDCGFMQFSGAPQLAPRDAYDMHKVCGFPLQDVVTGTICAGAIYEETNKNKGGAYKETKVVMLEKELEAYSKHWPV